MVIHPALNRCYQGLRILHARGADDLSGEQLGEVGEFVVESGSPAEGKLIRDIDWPPDVLLVGLRRGEAELIPRGGTRLLTGDYLLAMTPRSSGTEPKHRMRRLCAHQQE